MKLNDCAFDLTVDMLDLDRIEHICDLSFEIPLIRTVENAEEFDALFSELALEVDYPVNFGKPNLSIHVEDFCDGFGYYIVGYMENIGWDESEYIMQSIKLSIEEQNLIKKGVIDV